MQKKDGRLGLVDPKVTKTNLLYKWFINVKELVSPTFSSCLGAGWHGSTHREGEVGGFGLDRFTSKQHIGFMRSKVWGHIIKAWKIMVKGIYQLPPRTFLELLHSNIWWSKSLELINNNFTYVRAHELHCKGIQCVDDVWDNEYHAVLSWNEAHVKFNLTLANSNNWIFCASKIID